MIFRDWRSLSGFELERAFDQSLKASNMAEVLLRCANHSASAWQNLGAPRRVTYGINPHQGMDWFAPSSAPSQTKDAPLVFFIHGGAWRTGEAKDYALGVEALLANGAHLVVPDFSSVMALGGNLNMMIEELKRAFLLVQAMGPEMGVDIHKLYLCGHSSGAHLAACLVVAMANEPNEGFHAIASLLCCSGLYDLEPVRFSARGAYLTLSNEVVHALSPIHHVQCFTMPVHIMCGTFELPEFMRQSYEFAKSLADSEATVKISWVENLNHFEVLETLAASDGKMQKALLELIKNNDFREPK